MINKNDKKVAKGKEVLEDYGLSVQEVLTFALLDNPDTSIEDILSEIIYSEVEDIEAARYYIYSELSQLLK